MTPEELSALLAFLRRQAELVAADATGDGMALAAEKIIRGLTQDERDAAAMFFVVRLLKDRHRQKVVGIERASQRRRRRTVPFEATIPPDDPYWEQKAASEKRCYDAINAAVTAFVDAAKVEWTQELLNSTFALPDGSFVSWGEATVEQHESRRAMLVGNAAGNLEAAARHDQAITDCHAAGVDSLAQVRTAA